MYTINTKFDFVSRYPTKLEPLQLDRIKKHAKDYCHEFQENDIHLQGTYARPASIWGIIYIEGNVYIGGRISGQGMIVCQGNINLTDNVVHDDEDRKRPHKAFLIVGNQNFLGPNRLY
jgi:hypothetical protein